MVQNTSILCLVLEFWRPKYINKLFPLNDILNVVLWLITFCIYFYPHIAVCDTHARLLKNTPIFPWIHDFQSEHPGDIILKINR